MFCGKCGNKIKDGLRFCPKCGTQIRIPSDKPTGRLSNDSSGNGHNWKPVLIIAAAIVSTVLIVFGAVFTFYEINRSRGQSYDFATPQKDMEAAASAEDMKSQSGSEQRTTPAPQADPEPEVIVEPRTDPEPQIDPEPQAAAEPQTEYVPDNEKEPEVMPAELVKPAFRPLESRSDIENVDHYVEMIDGMYEQTNSGIYDGVGRNNFRVRKTSDGNQINELIKSFVGNGDPEIDRIMGTVGYKQYDLEYYYDNPDYFDTIISDGPNLIIARIDGSVYKYYFVGNNLIRRVAPEGSSDNPKTNDFLSELYRFGFEFRWWFNFGD